jgi:hypothetical protein
MMKNTAIEEIKYFIIRSPEVTLFITFDNSLASKGRAGNASPSDDVMHS